MNKFLALLIAGAVILFVADVSRGQRPGQQPPGPASTPNGPTGNPPSVRPGTQPPGPASTPNGPTGTPPWVRPGAQPPLQAGPRIVPLPAPINPQTGYPWWAWELNRQP
jgi:hypothetical protein